MKNETKSNNKLTMEMQKSKKKTKKPAKGKARMTTGGKAKKRK